MLPHLTITEHVKATSATSAALFFQIASPERGMTMARPEVSLPCAAISCSWRLSTACFACVSNPRRRVLPIRHSLESQLHIVQRCIRISWQAVIGKVRNLRAEYGLVKQRVPLFLVCSDAAKAAVLRDFALEISTLATSSGADAAALLHAGPAVWPSPLCALKPRAAECCAVPASARVPH